MTKSVQLTGMRFGYLSVLELSAGTPRKWLCQCDCGAVISLPYGKLASGHTKSCGCLRKKSELNPAYKHGHSKRNSFSPEYHSWTTMIQRCTNPNRRSWKHYGALGVTVCERWMKFENFLSDMGSRPSGTSLDRVDPYSGYSPENCIWGTQQDQTAHKREKDTHAALIRRTILWLLLPQARLLPDIYALLDLHPEVVKKEIRTLRKAGMVSTEPVKGRTAKGKTLLCTLMKIDPIQ